MANSEFDFKEVSPLEEEVIATRGLLNALFKTVLRRWRTSQGEEIEFPEEVHFPSGSLSSMAKWVAAGAFDRAVRSGEILVAVSYEYNQPVFKASEFFSSDPDDSPPIIAGFFPCNFEARCMAEDIDTEDAIERCITRLLCLDAKMKAEKKERTIIPLKRQNSFVRIVVGSIHLSEKREIL